MSAPSPVLLRAARPAGPVLWYAAPDAAEAPRGRRRGGAEGPAGPAVLALPAVSVEVAAECHVATAFVTLTVTFINSSSDAVSALFALPSRGTVTSAEARVGENRLLETAVVPSGAAEELAGDDKTDERAAETARLTAAALALLPPERPGEAYVPGLFRLAVPEVAPGETVAVTVRLMEALEFVDGSYHYTLPLAFAPGTLSGAAPLGSTVRVRANIHSVAPNVHFSSSSHDLLVAQQAPYYVSLEAVHNRPESAAFHLSYFAPSEQIMAGLLVEAPSPYSADRRGSFALVVTPPTRPMGRFARNVVFLLDRSGSMHGAPFAEAARALGHALDRLTPEDSFNVVAFDDQQAYFNLGLAPATPAAVAAAKQFVAANPPRGLTDIATPLLWAVDMLNQQPPVTKSGLDALPFVVLATDGCVANEREICRTVAARAGRCRISTFGIGPYANHYFLKMLALLGKGFSSAVAYQEEIFPEIRRLMQRQAAPVLTDVRLLIQLDECELYPFPIPDLFVGEPLTVAGKFPGAFPAQVVVQGRLASGRPFQQTVYSAGHNANVPVGKVFVKQRIDAMCARQWLEDSEELRLAVEQLSVEESYPSPFTSMVAYETTVQRKAEVEAEERKRREEEDAAAAGGGGPQYDPNQKPLPRPVTGKSRAGRTAALAVGGVVLVGAGLYAFGDVAATTAGVQAVGSAGTDLLSHVTDLGCCADLANCVSCGQCPDCSCFEPCAELPGCGACGDACQWVGDCFGGGACEAASGACEPCQPACDWVGDCCGGGACDFFASAAGGAGDCCAGLGSCCEPACEFLGQCLNGGCCDFVGDLVGGGVEAVGGCLGSVDCSGLGDVCGEVCQCLGAVLEGLAGADC